MTLLHEENGETTYILDNGSGIFGHRRGLAKYCVIVKDGELYGRTEMYLPHHVTVYVNLHDDTGKQVSFKEGNRLYYLTEDALGEITDDLKDEMLKLASNCNLK